MIDFIAIPIFAYGVWLMISAFRDYPRGVK
jgi:hypothetical protein